MSKPFQLLQTFTEKEFINFQKLLDSGYLSTNPRLSKLLKILTKKVNVFKSFTPALQHTLFESIYGKDKKFASKTLNELMNDLLKAAEKFLMFEKIKNTDEHHATLLFPELINRKQIPLYSSRVKAAEKKLSTIKKRGDEYHNKCYEIEHEKARLMFIGNKLMKEDNYDVLQYHADVKYLLQKLQYHLAKITLQRRYANKTFNLKPFIALKALLDLSEYQSNPLIQLYLLNIQLAEKEEETTFLALSNLLKVKQEVIPAYFLKPFYTNLNNYCIYKMSRGSLNYCNYLFDIYKDMHQAKLLIKNNAIDIGILKNIITISCRVKDYDWAVMQLAYYIKYVPNKIRNWVFEYNSGIIAFNQYKYDEALRHFNQVRKIDDTHELSLRIVQLQCFYETDTFYEISTQQMVDSLKIYIHQNKKLTKQDKVGYFNFIRIFNNLYKLKDIRDRDSKGIVIKKTVPKLKDRLSHFQFIRKKQWLLSKIKTLESNHLQTSKVPSVI